MSKPQANRVLQEDLEALTPFSAGDLLFYRRRESSKWF